MSADQADLMKLTPGAPPWATRAVELVNACESSGLRIKRLHLVAAEAEALDRYTGQCAYLLGYPVVVKRGSHLSAVSCEPQMQGGTP